MKLAICDDEKNIRNYIEKCAKEIQSDLETEQYPDAKDILKPGFDADILFLDIQMPEIDGMRAARILRTAGSKTVIVFVTAVEEMVFQAFDVDAIQYIVKPFDKGKLQDAVRKAVAVVKEREAGKSLPSADEADSGFIIVKSGGVNTRVVLSEIAYAEIFDRMVVLHMIEKNGNRPAISEQNNSLKSGSERIGAQISYYGRMTELEHVAGSDFFRIHRAYLVNLKHVSSYDSRSVCVLGNILPIARGKYPELVKAYMSYYTRQEKL